MSRRGAIATVLLAAAAAPGTAHAVQSAELFKNQAEVYGRFEARIRYAPGEGVVSSFFLWKVGSEVSGTYWNELDFEKLNADCRMQTNTLYGNPLMTGEETHRMPADICEAYHDYAYEWTPEYIAWFIDGREIRRVTGAVATAFAQNASGGMRVHFNVWPGNADFGGNFNPSILPVRQYISWAQYSAYTNGRFELRWREDFNGPGVPAGWSTGDWLSPYMNSTHNAANVTFSNGIAILSLTADGATGFTGTPPADSGSTAGAGGTGAGGGGTGGAPSGGRPQMTGGTAGAAGNGGAMSAAGTGGSVSAGSGGTSNTAGTPSVAGALGIAGAGNAGSGGVSAGSGGASGAMSGSGGTPTVVPSAGAPPAAGGSVSVAGAPQQPGTSGSGPGPVAGDDSGGCSCRVAPSGRGYLGAIGAAALLALAGMRRRRR